MKLNPPRFLFCFAFLCGQLIPSPATSACIPSCDANVRHEVCKDSQCVCDDDYVRLNGNCVKKPVDPTLCLSYPCMNGGNCTAESATVFNCTCADGYEGRTCEKEEMCSEERCLNGGTCQRNSSGSSCMCTYGYEGDHCEIKVECADFLLDEYQPKCNPNATCVFTPGNFNESICICNSSFTGNGTHCVQIIEIKNNTTDITTEISPTSTSTAVSTSSGGSDATREATTSTSTSTSKVGIIVGVVCGLAAIALVCICLFLWYRSRRGTLDIPTSNSKFYDTHQYATVRFETDNKGCGGIVAEDTSPAKLSALYETMHDPRLQKNRSKYL
eukprot:m.135807 g.135807  ORF g.135807 m.135807 type:complete len:329 (+) comp38169_c0_seq3:530-1516(+)